MVASYNIVVKDSRSCCKGTLYMLVSSINIYPSPTSKIFKRLRAIVDLPAPVLPTIPIFSALLITKEKFWSAFGKLALYLTEIF